MVVRLVLPEGACSSEYAIRRGRRLVDGDSARGTWYQQEFLHQKDGVRRNITGLYEDEYVRSGGRWLFRKRVYNILNAEETPAAG
jgi:hypothetical protein